MGSKPSSAQHGAKTARRQAGSGDQVPEGGLKHGRQPRSATTSVVADGPVGNRFGNSMSLITIAAGPAVRADSNEETARSPHGAEHWSVEANLNSDCQLAGARDD